MKVYVGLGGNLGNVERTFKAVLAHLVALPDLTNLEVSPFYWNPAVSPFPQPDFLNGVCRFNWGKDPYSLFIALQNIQKLLGQPPKPKDAPRYIDLDLLFFGNQAFYSEQLEVPHPRWKERLFVLTPLSDLTDTIEVAGEIFDIHQMKAKLYEKCTR